jgi:hypothetical protein
MFILTFPCVSLSGAKDFWKGVALLLGGQETFELKTGQNKAVRFIKVDGECITNAWGARHFWSAFAKRGFGWGNEVQQLARGRAEQLR